MMELTELRPPEPIESWPVNLALFSGEIVNRGESVFEGTGEPWSTARRFDGGVQLEWEGVQFEVSAEKIIVCATNPVESVDLYWNTLVAVVFELRGITCLHGFMVEAPNGEGLAVLGNSGAGKTTTGRALLEHGCTLVCDDLVTLSSGVPPMGRPFVRRLPEANEIATLDVGGKIREPYPLALAVPELQRALVLDKSAADDGTRLEPMKALDHLLRNPYVPMEISHDSAARRLGAIVEEISALEVIAARPKSRTPQEFADLLLTGAV